MNNPTLPPPRVTPRYFFVPGASDLTRAEEAWGHMRANCGFATTERRAQRLVYNNWRGVFTSEVGYRENDDEFEWLTAAILEPAEESDPWTIAVMPFSERQAVRRYPHILVGTSDVLNVTDFLAAE